jgi:hypothetical protein
MRRARVDIRLRQDEKSTWIAESEARGLDLSEAMRRAMPHYFKTHPKKRKR